MRRLAALALLVALAGCGGDEGSSGPTLEEFAREAHEVCGAGGERIQEMGEPDLSEFDEFARRFETVFDDTVRDLRALERPSGEDGEKAAEFVAAYERELDEIYLPALRRVARAARRGDDRATLRAAQRFTEVETPESDRLAKEIGARACYQ